MKKPIGSMIASNSHDNRVAIRLTMIPGMIKLIGIRPGLKPATITIQATRPTVNWRKRAVNRRKS